MECKRDCNRRNTLSRGKKIKMIKNNENTIHKTTNFYYLFVELT
uniref:Uncharacterized protein n=1 Tax=Anopheles quadriannulatus TaxID=34691 RepID=A0A182XS72_ANOQN